MVDIYQALLSQGVAGIIVAVIVLPLIKWLMAHMNGMQRDFMASQSSFLDYIKVHADQLNNTLSELKQLVGELKGKMKG